MNRYLKIGLVLSCCVWWEAQAFSQVKIRFGETCRQEEIQVGFREQVYKIKLDELGAGMINIPASLAPGHAVLYGPRSISSFYLVPGQQQEITKLSDQKLNLPEQPKQSTYI